MNDNELCEIMSGMDKVNHEMAQKIAKEAPMCHFRKMFLERSDDEYYQEWWECSVCGHTEDIKN